MTSIARTARQHSLDAEQLLKANWRYTGAVVLETESLNERSHHRILTKWQDEKGKELCFLLNFVASSCCTQQLVMPSSQCHPQIDRRVKVLDKYGFEIHHASRRTLEWDLLMQLDLEPVTQDLHQRLFTH